MLSILLFPLALFGVLILALRTDRRDRRLPPGPPTLPVLGDLHQIPRKRSYLKFTEWAKQYGGLYSLKMGTGTAVVITNRRIIKELVDKRSAKYSNRPASYVSHDLMTSGDHLLVMQYGQQWRSFRKIIHQHFMESMVERHHLEVQNAEAVQMLRDICHHYEFGIRIADTLGGYPTYDSSENWSQLMEPGATPPVDIYPLLHYIPQKLLGNWRLRSKDVGAEMNDLYARVLDRVIARRKSKGSRNSLMDSLLDQEEKSNLNRHQLYFLGGVLMEGGSDTSSSLILAFIHAMTKWGDVLVKAQQEIDSVIDEDRTPVWSDYTQLPFVATIVKEAQRWRPVVPLAFPHAAAEDDWIDGYLIPKDATVIINSWGMHHDETRFSNPDVFDPDHYKGQTTLAPELAAAADYESRDHYGYGSGRRICPGIHLAERNLFLAIAKLIWAFSIEPSLDEQGQPIKYDFSPQTGYSEGFLVCVKDFPCVIKPRSETRRATIMREMEEAQRNVFSQFHT
ncbi:cytochrome P450 [Penicillium hetheringtonii]|uniref:Cytochrome P450 n=1 Tax=Penicillium hetheringtonii TaxID=911720 RepID=A0AAD6DBY0_9EURO|nr:cytochrome P450 [Penicillium hetheringtonii]